MALKPLYPAHKAPYERSKALSHRKNFEKMSTLWRICIQKLFPDSIPIKLTLIKNKKGPIFRILSTHKIRIQVFFVPIFRIFIRWLEVYVRGSEPNPRLELSWRRIQKNFREKNSHGFVQRQSEINKDHISQITYGATSLHDIVREAL